MRRATKIFQDPADVATRLEELFGSTAPELLHVVGKVVAARHEAVLDDPLGTAGLFAYIHGTRNIRGLFKPKGWAAYRAENVEAVRHAETGRLIVYQNVDLAGDRTHSPQAPSGKGNGAARLIEAAHGLLFADDELPEVVPAYVGEAKENWYFCVSCDQDEIGELVVGAELSLALPLQGGNFNGFSERIMILPHGPWHGGRARENIPMDDAAEFEPQISRKQ